MDTIDGIPDQEIAPAPPGPPPLRRTVLIVILGVTAALLVIVGSARWLAGVAGGDGEPTFAPGRPVVVAIPEGASARRIGAILEEAEVITASAFELEVRARNQADLLQAGEHELVTAMDVDELLEVLTTPPAPAEVYRVTVIEGLTIGAVLDALAVQTPYDVAELAVPLLDGTVTSRFRADAVGEALTPWEGLLFPDTYEFLVDAAAADILGELASTLERRFDSIDWTGLEAAGLSPYEALVAASLIEKEAKLDEERPLIASVIFNRLEAGMPLQIDATIIYALGENTGRVLLEDLEIDSPYNTYRYPGLPPTPIGTVRRASLEAVAVPADTDYLYYVLIDAETGEHGFTASYDEFLDLKAAAKASGAIP